MVAVYYFAQDCVRSCISAIARAGHQTLAKSCRFAMLIGFSGSFTCLCNDTAPLSLAVIMCEQAEGAAATTTVWLPPVSGTPLLTPFIGKMALATILHIYVSKLLGPAVI
jgi:hypothetical protein